MVHMLSFSKPTLHATRRRGWYPLMRISPNDTFMDTKRCAYCHKLVRADATICSGCGHPFVSKKSRPPGITQPSLPPASPHRAGHYSGLHPEDQPYQTNQIFAVPWSEALIGLEAGKPLEREPEHIV